MHLRNSFNRAIASGFLLAALCQAGNAGGQAASATAEQEDNTGSTTKLAPKDRDSGHVYRMNYGRSIAFGVIATAANIYAIPNLIKAKDELTDAELQALNPDAINGFDSWALRQDPTNRHNIDVLSDRLLTVTSAGVAALFLDKDIRKHWLRIATLYYETSAVTFSYYNFSPFGPLFQNRVRPFAYYNYFSAEDRKEGNSRNSFYSGHVANAAASTFFMAKVYSDYHPEIGGKKYLLYGLATIPPLVISYLRVKALFHFPSDCLVGLIIGAANGVLIPEMHRIKNRNLTIGLNASSESAGLALVWKFGNKAK